MASISPVCPRCWTPYRPGAKRCPRCGFDLQQQETASFIDLFGPPEVLRRRYDIQDTLAQSRVGHVYQALDLETRSPCAIKELSGAVLSDPLEAELAAARLEQRVRQLSRLTHPNLVRIHDLLSEGSRHFVIMDLVEGPTLAKVLKGRDRPVPEPIALRWGDQLCDALGYMHEQDPSLLFPDLAAHHVILVSDSQPILVDLGLTRIFQSRWRESQAFTDDIAALGTLLYQVLTLRHLSSARHAPIRQLNPQVSTFTAQAIARATSREATERFPSMARFKEALLAEPLSPQSPTTVIPHIEPYELTPGRQAHTLQELAQACQEEWEAGVAQFFEGTLTTWLREVADRLREAGQERAARDASAAAEGGERLRKDAQKAGAVQRQAAFFQWLSSTGYAWGQPQLAVRTAHLRLGAVKGELRLGAIFKAVNTGTGFLVGEVHSEVEWLLVREEKFGCRGRQAAQITVELRDRSVLSRPLFSDRALHVTSNGGEAWVGASIAAPRPALTLDQQVIDFGEVLAGAPARSSVVIRNMGGGSLTGRISATVPWLHIPSAHFRCPAGRVVLVDVELRTDLLPAEPTVQDSALIVDSDYGQTRVEVKATRVQPRLELLPQVLDFGTIDSLYRISQTLRVTNSNRGLLEGTVTSCLDWLTVEQPAFRCGPNETALIPVWVDPTSLPGGHREVPAALVIDSNGGYQPLTVRLAVRRPLLHVERRPLDFGTLLPGQEKVLPLSVGNQGVTPLHVELIPRTEWLTVEPTKIMCADGEEVKARLTLRVPMRAHGGVLQLDRALYLASDGGVASVDLRVEIVSPRLEVDPKHLDFGLIGPSEVVRGQLRLRNGGSGMLEWHLAGEFTWLEVFPRQGSCASGEWAIVEVNGFALAVPEGTTSAQALLQIESNAGHFEVPISVAIAAPVLAVQPLLLSLGTSENYAPLQRPLRIANHGGGHLTGDVAPQVGWLRAQPTLFDCVAGSVAEVTVLADPRGLSQGETVVSEALVVSSNSGQETVDVRLEVALRPILQVMPDVLTFSISGAAGERAATERLTLANQGYGPLRVRFQPTVEWLATDRGSSTLRHGRRVRVKVSLNVDGWLETGQKDQEARVEIRVGEETLASIPVTIIEG